MYVKHAFNPFSHYMVVFWSQCRLLALQCLTTETVLCTGLTVVCRQLCLYFQMYYSSGSQGGGGHQVRYMCPTMPYIAGSQQPQQQQQPPQPQQQQQQPAGLVEGQNQGAAGASAVAASSGAPQPNGHYPVSQYMPTYTNYQLVTSYPSMTVQSVDGFNTQTYHTPITYQGAPPSQGQTGEVGGAQYPPVVSSQQASGYVQTVPVYYNTTSTGNSINGSTQVAAYPSIGPAQPATYRPHTPPNGQPQMAPSMNSSSATPPQFISYTSYPQVAPQRTQAPSVVSYPTPSPQQPYSLVRPNMQMSMQMQTRTTPPPQGVGVAMTPTYTPMPIVGTQPIKVYSVDQRGTEVTAAKETSNLTPGLGSQGHPQPQVKPAIVGTLQVRPAAPTSSIPYRAPTPLSPGKYTY